MSFALGAAGVDVEVVARASDAIPADVVPQDFDRDVWDKVWTYAQEFRARLRIARLTVQAVSANLNSNRDLHTLYQRAVGASGDSGAPTLPG